MRGYFVPAQTVLLECHRPSSLAFHLRFILPVPLQPALTTGLPQYDAAPWQQQIIPKLSKNYLIQKSKLPSQVKQQKLLEATKDAMGKATW